MKPVLFTYETPLGTFWIRPEPAGRVQLGLGNLKLRTYASAKAAAESVRSQTTGHEEWDRASNIVLLQDYTSGKPERPTVARSLGRRQRIERGMTLNSLLERLRSYVPQPSMIN